MKKILIYAILGGILPGLLILLLITAIAGGSAEPIQPPAEEAKAMEYMEIASELGTPWDIILVADSIFAVQNKKSGIEDVNPLITSLQFCIIKEDHYTWVVTTDPETGETSGEWEYVESSKYTGLKEILTYISVNDIVNLNVSQFVALVNEVAGEKGGENDKYESTVILNNDFEYVLKNFVELSDENVKKVIELHESRYIILLYNGTGTSIDKNVTLPNVVVGDITRSQLAQTAVSLINHPYQLGGKFSKKGIPDVPLDCSGFVDWTYIQCFGKGVSAGTLPPGVAMSGTALQFYACSGIQESELIVGDLGFLNDPAQLATGSINHVGIYIGKINGKDAFVHCAGRRFGYAERPTGRVGISINQNGIMNSTNNVTGGTFAPAMNGIRFSYFRRPNFQFKDDIQEEN